VRRRVRHYRQMDAANDAVQGGETSPWSLLQKQNVNSNCSIGIEDLPAAVAVAVRTCMLLAGRSARGSEASRFGTSRSIPNSPCMVH
jgi:hypothetical protein